VTKSHDPYGQSDPGNGNFYGFKANLEHMIAKAKREIAKLERLLHAQPEIINDATRAAVYRELIADLKQEAGSYAYDAGYAKAYGPAGEGARLEELAEKLNGWANYLTNYGWSKKYTVDGEPKALRLEDKVDDAYIRGGAKAVLELMAK
jgi:hypothetical protein